MIRECSRNIRGDVDQLKNLFFLWFVPHETAEEGDKLSITFPNRDLARRLVESGIL